MQKEYQLNKKEKAWMKKNGRKLCLYWEETKWQRIILIHVFTWLPLVILPFAIIIAYAIGEEWDLGVAVSTMVGFFTWIPAGIYYNEHKHNSEIFCKYNGNESLILEENRVVYKLEYLFSDLCIKEYQMDFDKITRIEKNEKLRKVTVYGTYGIPTTRKSDDGKGVQTSTFNYLGNREVWCKIPLYFDGIDELIEIMSEKSGVPVVKVKEIATPKDYLKDSLQPKPRYIEVPE